MSYIPIIDLSKIGDIPENPQEDNNWNSTADDVRKGLAETGFIYLINHGIEEKVIEDGFAKSKQFFELPMTTKMLFRKAASDFSTEYHSVYGYSQPGQELLHPTSTFEFRETYDYIVTPGEHPDADVPGFEVSIRAVQEHSAMVAKKLFLLMGLGLRMDDPKFFMKRVNHFDDHKASPASNVRIIHYPPVPSEFEILPGTVRCGEHSDYSVITLLFQDLVGGLEAQRIDGTWIPVTPIPGSIVVNTGQLLQMWTKGIFPATPHRILIPDSDERRRSRVSIAHFISVDNDCLVTPLKIEMTESEARRLEKESDSIYDVEPIVAMDYIMERIKKTYMY